MLNFGKVKPGTTLYIPFNTFDSNDPSGSVTITGLALADIKIFKDGGATERASTSGFTLLDTDGIDFSGETGIHGVSIDLADNTTDDFYEAGSQFWVVIGPITVDAATVNFVAATFEIGYEGSILDTVITTRNSATQFILEEGSADNDAYNGCLVYIHDQASAVQFEIGVCSDYVGSTKTLTIAADPAIFTTVAGDNISIMPPANVAFVGGTAQTAGDIVADTEAVLADTEAAVPVLTDTEAIIADTEAAITERSTLLTDTEAILVDTEAAVPVLTDTEAILADTEAAITERSTLLTDTEAILVDTEGLGASGLTPLASGTAQSATAGTIVLAAAHTFADDELNGTVINITGGTGVGQSRLITDYTGASDTATISPNWTTNPSSDSTYEVVQGTVNLQAVALTVQTAGDIIADTEVILVDTEASRVDEAAILVDTEAAVPVLTDTEAILADTEAAITERSTLLTDTEAVLADTEAAITERSTLLTDTEAILVDTEGLGASGLTPLASGTAQSATAGTIVLAAAHTFGDDILNGAVINILTGTGAGQSRVITDYAGATDTATVSPNWTTNPSSDSTYEIVQGSTNLSAVGLTVQTAGDIIADTEAILSDTEGLSAGSGLTPLASGTAQGGTVSTIQLAVAETFADDELNGNVVKITSGTGAGQSRLITDYAGGTDTATISPNWTTTPSSDSVYEVVDGAANLVAVGLTAQTAGDIIADTELLLVDTEASRVDEAAILVDTEAAIPVLADTEAIIADTEGGVALTAAAVDAIWDELLTGADHNTAQSAGRRLRELADAGVITSGTAQAGGAASLTLAAGESSTNDIFAGDRIVIVGGLGVGEHGIITTYDGGTKVATMSQNWVITPDNTSEYELIPADVDVETWQHTAATNVSGKPDVNSTTLLADTEAILVDTEAAAPVLTDTEAILADTEAAITERATILTDTEASRIDEAAILVDTEAAVPVLADTEAILTDTEARGLSPLATGTAQAGTASTIQLAAAHGFADDELNGNVVNVISGTGAGQSRVITDYAGATDTATVSPNWTTNPSSDSVYEVVQGSTNLAAVSLAAQTAGDIIADTEVLLVDTHASRVDQAAILVDTEAAAPHRH
jgi:hypothetical protein